MRVEIDAELHQAFQEFTSMKMGPKEVEHFMDFFLWVGVGTVRETLKRHPDMTFGDLVMLFYRINHH